MTTFRTRAATRLVSVLRVKQKLQALADAADDPVRLGRLLEKTRRNDRRDPPSRMVKRPGYEQIDVAGHALHWFGDSDDTRRRVILYLHGGGYMFGPFAPEWKMAESIAADTNSDLAVFLYPRAPEHLSQDTVEATLEAYRSVLDRYTEHQVVLVGASAGGGLGVVLMVEAARRGMRVPSRAVLVSPGVDMELSEAVDVLEDGDVLLSADYVRLAGTLYAGSLGAGHPWVSPTNGDLKDLPPMQVFAGSDEILLPSITTFVDRARAAGSSADLIVGDGQQHTWPTLPTPEGRQARDAMTHYIKT